MDIINWNEYESTKIENFPPMTPPGAIEIIGMYNPYFEGWINA